MRFIDRHIEIVICAVMAVLLSLAIIHALDQQIEIECSNTHNKSKYCHLWRIEQERERKEETE